MKEKSKVIKFNYPTYEEITDEMTDITAIYLRVSTDSQAQDGYGLDVQYGANERYCKAYDIQNVVVFVDDGYTGMNDKRPAFQCLLKLMKEKRIKFVITHSLDRIGRTQMLILKFLKEDCAKAECDFFAVKDSIDSRSKQTYGILISILSIFAEMDHDAIVTKLFLGRKQRALEGLWKGGGNPPYGYYYSKEIRNLAVDPDKAIIVRKIFELYNSMEFSPLKIATVLGLSSDVVVFNVLKNRTYLGEITFKGEQYPGVHQRLISDEDFDKAQRILKSRSVTRNPSTYLLSSLLYCGRCGAKMRYMQYGKGKNKKLKLICYSQYESNGKRNLIKDQNCANYKYDAEQVEEAVVQIILNSSMRYKDDIKEKLTTDGDVIEGLTKKISELKTEYDRLVKAYQRLGDDSILDEAEKVKFEIKKQEKNIEVEKEKKGITKMMEEKAEMLRTLPDVWGKLDERQKQNVVRAIVHKVVLTAGKIQVYLKQNEYEQLLVGKMPLNSSD
jgi:site-specific DNA recombinase